MEKVFLIIRECEDAYYGDIVDIFKNEEEARKNLRYHYKFKRFAELYEAELIDNTGMKRAF